MQFILRKIAGIILLLVGVAGLFLPVIPGIIFLIIGIGILAPDSKFSQKVRTMLRLKMQKKGVLA